MRGIMSEHFEDFNYSNILISFSTFFNFSSYFYLELSTISITFMATSSPLSSLIDKYTLLFPSPKTLSWYG